MFNHGFFSYNIYWESEFDNIVSKRNKQQDLNLNQYIEVLDNIKKGEKTTTISEAVNDEDVINKGYPDEKLSKVNGHISLSEKITTILNYNTTNNI